MQNTRQSKIFAFNNTQKAKNTTVQLTIKSFLHIFGKMCTFFLIAYRSTIYSPLWLD